MHIKHLLTIFALLAAGLLPAPVQAGGVVTVCDEAHLLAALAGGGTVTFGCSGVITLTNTIVISTDTTIDGSGQEVIISGNDAVRVFIVNAGVTVTLNGLSVANGNTGYNGIGGGINNSGSMTVSNCIFHANRAHIFGGAISNYYGTLIVSNSIFTDNDAYRGGGIYNGRGTLIVSETAFSSNHADRGQGGAIDNRGITTIDSSTFLENSAIAGGGIHSWDSTLTVSNSTFTNNHADAGGSIDTTLGTVTIDNSTFSDNHARNGGGIHSNSTMTVDNSMFSGNSAADRGGGIYNGQATLTVINSTFSINNAPYGGSVYNNGSYAVDGDLRVSNSTFSNNRSVYIGAGILNDIYGTSSISNTTFSNNHADAGGGIANYGTMIVGNSSFSSNRASIGGGICNASGTATASNATFFGNIGTTAGGGIYNQDYEGAVIRLSNTIVATSPDGDNCSGDITDGGGNLSYPDTTCPGINADPLLGLLQDNGGPTWTMALAPGSPAIDVGDDATCEADPVNNRDQRGVTRPQGVHCDIGAFERPIKWLPIILVE
jgi:predicted outer membrane repeat protein